MDLGRIARGVGRSLRDRLRSARDRARRAPAWSARRARKTARIARWEVSTGANTLDRRTIVVLLLVVLAAGAVAPATIDAGGLDADIYRVAVDEDHPYHEPVEDWDTLRVVDDAAEADLVLTRGSPAPVNAIDEPKEHAAHSEFREAVEAYNDRRLAAENASSAAFPVVVDVTYSEQTGSPLVDTGDGASGDGSGAGESDDGNGGSGVDGSGGDGDPGSSGGTDGSGSDGGDGTDGSGTADGGDDGSWLGGGQADGGSGSRLPVPNLGGRFGGSQTGTPAEISPPFPFGSLVLAFLFVIPMNFVIQAYASTIMEERLNRRGELLLVSPVTRLDIVGGKTLPYFGVMALVTTAIAALVGGGPLSVFAVLPVALLFLATTFVGAMFARSYKELTFVTVTISVLLTTYVFVPAIFTDVTPIALISPLTLVVLDLQGAAVSAGEALFSTVPFLLATVVCFGLGLGVYREEDMFTQLPVHRKAVDALAAWIWKPWHVGAVTALMLPFAFVLELLAVALLFALPASLSLPVIMVLVALIEEVAKSAHVYAAFEHERFERTPRTAVVLGAASGTGFFVAEKAGHAVQLVGLQQIDEGLVAFTPELGVGPVLALALFLAPLALHCVTAVTSALGARGGARRYAIALGGAIVLHAAYNLGVIALVA